MCLLRWVRVEATSLFSDCPTVRALRGNATVVKRKMLCTRFTALRGVLELEFATVIYLVIIELSLWKGAWSGSRCLVNGLSIHTRPWVHLNRRIGYASNEIKLMQLMRYLRYLPRPVTCLSSSHGAPPQYHSGLPRVGFLTQSV